MGSQSYWGTSGMGFGSDYRPASEGFDNLHDFLVRGGNGSGCVGVERVLPSHTKDDVNDIINSVTTVAESLRKDFC